MEIKNNRNNNNSLFSFFENFAEFKNELSELSTKFSKIEFLYRLYLNYYDGSNFANVIFFSSNPNLQDKILYTKIAKLMNCIAEKNQLIVRNPNNIMDEDNVMENEYDKIHLESDFYLIINHLKDKFKIPNECFSICDIVDFMIRLTQEFFDGCK
jgi:hypothetical protein